MKTLWKNEFLLNLREIDEQHRRFFAICERLTAFAKDFSEGNADILNLFPTLMELRTYAFVHFHTEESLLMERKYAHYFDHAAEHDTFITTMNTFRSDFIPLFKAAQSGENNATEVAAFLDNMLNFVTAWLTNHILEDDNAYATALRQ